MNDKPILFSGPMVRAILSGTKSQTRRVVNPQPDEDGLAKIIDGPWVDTDARKYKCPYGQPGETLLWVRETWQHTLANDGSEIITIFGADYTQEEYEQLRPWKPSIHICRDASRLTLKVTGVRVERLQDISCADIRLEGLSCNEHDFPGGFCAGFCPSLYEQWVDLWDSINGKPRENDQDISWDANPWVWVVSFEPICMNIDQYIKENT